MVVAAAVEAGSAVAAGAGAVEARTATAATESGLLLLAGGGEEWRTLGRKMCPPWVFSMVGLEKERREGVNERRRGFRKEWQGEKVEGV